MTEPRMTHEQARDLAAAYVLGALERSEEAAVRDHLATCVEPHPEFEAFGGVVPALDLVDLELVEPPAALGARIMAAAAADLAAHPRASAAPASAPPASASPVSAPSPVAFPTAAERTERTARAERTRASRFDWALRIAAVIAIVAVGYWGLDLQRQLDRSQRFERAVASVVQTAAQAGSKTVILAAAGAAGASGIGAVAPDGSVVLALRDLPATSGSQVYEAWVIVGKAAPIAVGGFTVDSNGTASFTTRPAATPAGALIALTLEPKEGNTAPTLPIIAAGQAVAPPASS
jgi:anti-sigma-K factor RskA